MTRPGTDLFADFFDLRFAKLSHGPVAFEAANMANKIREQLAPIRGVDDLRVKLCAIEFAHFIGDDSKRCPVRGGYDLKAGRELRNLSPRGSSRPDAAHLPATFHQTERNLE